VGDVGFGVVEAYVERFPERYLNVGVAEQNLAGVAAGLALSGLTSFMYSIANFPTLRCLEQIRNDICYNDANVKIVSVGAGLAYGSLGATHHATEDLAIMRALPNMTVVAPADPFETEAATRALATLHGPAYMRIGRSGDPAVHKEAPAFEIGRAITIREGHDVAIIATGAITHSAIAAAEELSRDGISCRVVSMHTLKPLDTAAIRDVVSSVGTVVTVEEHSLVGGLGSAVAEVLADQGLFPMAFRRFGLPDAFGHRIGSRDYLLAANALSPQAIAAGIRDLLSPTRRRPTAAVG
jgi:transketolase